MATITTIDPISRLEGHLKVDISVDLVNGKPQVVDAWASGTLFRGFETLLIDRAPWDAQHITERICGVCPVSHGMAAVLALDKAANITVPTNGRLMRNLVAAANFIDSHILHFYHLSLPDFVDGPDMPPWTPKWSVDKRLSASESATYVNHYVAALDMRRKAHEMGALFGGRFPHPPAFIPGGMTTTPRAARIATARNYLNELIPFIRDVYLPDAEALAGTYSDYYTIGAGPKNLMSYGIFELDNPGTSWLLTRGRIENASSSVQAINTGSIAEQVTHSWYSERTNNLNPASGRTLPQYPKDGAYSWIKSPRYNGLAYEAGPLSRMWINGDYRRGISVADRMVSRAYETLKIALACSDWLDQLVSAAPVQTPNAKPTNATSYGLTEAPRGAIGHWVQIANSKISRYQVITPTCWNASPRDSTGQRGPLEQALIGTPVANIAEPQEVVRVIHSYDPCLACAVHVMRPDEGVRIFSLGHFHGGDQVAEHAHDGREHSHDHGHGHSH